MILSIAGNFCSWWWLLWIAPFLLGLMLGATLWRKYLSRSRELEESLENHKSTIQGLEGDLNKCKRELVHNDVALEEQKSLNKNLTNQRSQLLRNQSAPSIPKQNPIQSNIISESQSKPISIDYSKIASSNLQVIEGIGTKMESILKSNGINDWKQLSSRSKGELRAILEKYDSKYVDKDSSSWPKQAFKAMNRDWEGLIKLQEADGADSKLLKIATKLGLA